jgi:hypothetical protein
LTVAVPEIEKNVHFLARDPVNERYQMAAACIEWNRN